jgi:hypothetical protein
MRQDSYYRLHEACLAMANQCTEPEVQARWLTMADAWLKRSLEISENRRVMKHELSEPRAAGPPSADAPDRV